MTVPENVVKTVGANIRIAETSQIGNHNVKTTTREVAHIAQPDAPGRRPPVDQQQRDPSVALPPVRQIASADTGALGCADLCIQDLCRRRHGLARLYNTWVEQLTDNRCVLKLRVLPWTEHEMVPGTGQGEDG